MRTPFKRLMTASGLLAAVTGFAVFASTSALAYTPGRDIQSTTVNRGPQNSGVTAGGTTTPGGVVGATALYVFQTPASSPAGTSFISPAAGVLNAPGVVSGQFTNIGTMYQQWRQTTTANGVQWFYLYAANSNLNTAAGAAANSGTNNPTFAYYYYTKNRGQRVFSSGAGVQGAPPTGGGNAGINQTGQATAAGGTTLEGVIYNDAAGTVPIMTITTMSVSAVTAGCAQTTGAACQEQFLTALRWGLPQDTFKAGTVEVLEAVEGSNSTAGAQVAAGGINYYDPWGNNGGYTTLTLTDTAPTQSATGVSNLGTTAAPATRAAGNTYSFQQTVGDTNGDIEGGSLVFVYTSGANQGQWFQIGYINTDDNNNTVTATGGSSFYQSAFEAYNTGLPNSGTGATNSLASQYASFTATASCGTATTGTASGAQTAGAGCSSEVITYTVTFNTAARGTVNVYGNAMDYHGGTSGNVLVGAVTIS